MLGAGARHRAPLRALGRDHLFELGAETRTDLIGEVALYHTSGRRRLEAVREDEVVEVSGGTYAALTSRWHPRFRTELGLRGDVFHFDVDDALLSANSGKKSAGIVSPKASLIFTLDERSELYLSGGFGYHSNDARGVVIAVDPTTGEAAEPVDPLVRSRGAETGLRSTPIDGLNSTVSLWYLDLDSELVYVGDGGGTEASDESRRVGVEWTNFFRVLDGLTVDLDVAFSRSRFVGPPDGEDHVPGALENVLAGGVTWSDPGGRFATIRLRHLGAYSLIEDDSVRAEATNLVNAGVGASLGGTRVSLGILNLLDEKASDIQYYYASRLPGEPADGVEDVHFHPVEPRQVRATVAIGL